MNYIYSILFLLFISTPISAQEVVYFNTLRPNKITYFKKNYKEKNITNSDSISHKTYVDKNPRFHSPIDEDLRITSPYGYRIDPISKKKRFHSGVDIRTKESTLYSMFPGIVKKVGYKKRGLGNFIVIDHGNFETIYGHLSIIFLKKKDKVTAGSKIGISGSTGRATGDHLHLILKYRGKKVNPLPLLHLIEKEKSKII